MYVVLIQLLFLGHGAGREQYVRTSMSALAHPRRAIAIGLLALFLGLATLMNRAWCFSDSESEQCEPTIVEEAVGKPPRVCSVINSTIVCHCFVIVQTSTNTVYGKSTSTSSVRNE